MFLRFAMSLTIYIQIDVLRPDKSYDFNKLKNVFYFIA